MPPRIVQHGRCGIISALVAAALCVCPVPSFAQELPLQRDYPGSGPYQCAPIVIDTEPSPDERAQAGQLASEANQNVILGDLQRAEVLLARASEVNAASADLAYRHGRVLQDLGRLDEALAAFCQSRNLDTDSATIEDASQRMDSLYEEVRARLPVEARDAFISGIDKADAGAYDDAIFDFSIAMREAPNWGAPVYNRAVLYETIGLIGESLADYRHYLDVAPTAVDPVVVMVSERIGLLEAAASAATPSPAGAFVLGMVPGMGHFYSSRPVSGALVLTFAGAAVAAGFLVKDITVECVAEVPSGQPCPDADIVSEMTDRPLLLPGLGVAAAVTLVGAIEALINNRHRRAELQGRRPALPDDERGPSLELPSVSNRGDLLDLNLIRVRFN